MQYLLWISLPTLRTCMVVCFFFPVIHNCNGWLRHHSIYVITTEATNKQLLWNSKKCLLVQTPATFIGVEYHLPQIAQSASKELTPSADNPHISEEEKNRILKMSWEM